MITPQTCEPDTAGRIAMVGSGVGSVTRFPGDIVIQAIIASVTQVRVDGLSCLAFLSLLRIAWLLLQLLYFLGLGLSVIGCMIMSTAIVHDLRTELLVAR